MRTLGHRPVEMGRGWTLTNTLVSHTLPYQISSQYVKPFWSR